MDLPDWIECESCDCADRNVICWRKSAGKYLCDTCYLSYCAELDDPDDYSEGSTLLYFLLLVFLCAFPL